MCVFNLSMYALLYHSDEYRISYITVLHLYLITERLLKTSCFRACARTHTHTHTHTHTFMQAAITDFIRNDESVMKAIIDTVSNELVTKLIGNKSFIDALSQKLMENGVLHSVKQSVYEDNAMALAL